MIKLQILNVLFMSVLFIITVLLFFKISDILVTYISNKLLVYCMKICCLPRKDIALPRVH